MSELSTLMSVSKIVSCVINNHNTILKFIKSGQKFHRSKILTTNVDDLILKSMVDRTITSVIVMKRPLDYPMAILIPGANHHSLICILNFIDDHGKRFKFIELISFDYMKDSKYYLSFVKLKIDGDRDIRVNEIHDEVLNILTQQIPHFKKVNDKTHMDMKFQQILNYAKNYNTEYDLLSTNCKDFCQWLYTKINNYEMDKIRETLFDTPTTNSKDVQSEVGINIDGSRKTNVNNEISDKGFSSRSSSSHLNVFRTHPSDGTVGDKQNEINGRSFSRFERMLNDFQNGINVVDDVLNNDDNKRNEDNDSGNNVNDDDNNNDDSDDYDSDEDRERDDSMIDYHRLIRLARTNYSLNEPCHGIVLNTNKTIIDEIDLIQQRCSIGKSNNKNLCKKCGFLYIV
jgi:hypothetical protein